MVKNSIHQFCGMFLCLFVDENLAELPRYKKIVHFPCFYSHSSSTREEPFVFQIGKRQMNEGWERGLLNMCVGEKRRLVIPSDLAYGAVGGYGSESQARVRPGATLVYDVELLEILDNEAAAPHMVWNL